MTKEEFDRFAWNMVDEAIEHVFLRFPQEPELRSAVYTSVANQLLELDADLDLA